MTRDVTVEPMDRHNQELVNHVHPADWVNPEPAPRYNVVVIGAGTAGLVTAAGAAGLGAKVALVERHLMGGDCLNYGCVPSKCLIRSSRAAADVMHAEQFNVNVPPGVAVDFPAVMERMRRLRARISNNDSAERLRDAGVDIFLGEGRFTGRDTIDVGGETLRFKKAVIASGGRPVLPPVEGLAEAGFLTNETVFSLIEQPGHLAVIGGGPIGCELAQAFRRLGSEITIMQRGPQFLPREDRAAADVLRKVFQREGIKVCLNAEVKKVVLSNGHKVIHADLNGKPETVEVDEILVGVGRVPNVEGLGLELAGVAVDKRRGVVVNDRLQTTNSSIFAAGDVCMKFKFTHTADAAARIVLQNALFMGRKKLSALTVPWCTYTDPEIAHVGMYEKDAEEQGVEVTTFERSFADVDRAIADGEEEGFVKIHVKKGTDKILGATIMARHAGEMISEISVAMVGGVGLGTLATVIHPYPTQAEAIKQIADAYKRTRLTPTVKNLFTRWMKWTR